jgi:hypothetical protein
MARQTSSSCLPKYPRRRLFSFRPKWSVKEQTSLADSETLTTKAKGPP